MSSLDTGLRTGLEKTVKAAREVAETAAAAALEHLGVSEAVAFSHLSEADRELRRRLRAHGRQLGDSPSEGKAQSASSLVEEVAYEHWHRMLFARFLAENNLLMYPDPVSPVCVTLEECEDLASDEGAVNGWELAARFAGRMLPQIFRTDSPVFELKLPPEHQQRLEKLLADLPAEVFTASDSLGWVYQFWQSDNKDRINKAEVKIGARELPAVTQLFTEPYMVSFLLDNALGAWWSAKRLTEADWREAGSEADLREKAAIPGVPLTYLRFVREDDGRWAPAASMFEAWPKTLGELKVLDPCCGSGHFLVATFLMLVPMRMALEGLSARDAADAVLRENLHALELDPRCVELAAFALALAAWRYPGAGGYRALPALQVACSGLSVSVAKEEWKQLASGRQNVRIMLDAMYDTFKDAPALGSLIDPMRSGAAKMVQWFEKMGAEEMAETLGQAMTTAGSDEQREMGVVAQGLSKAAVLLSRRYHFVVTNVPYLSSAKQAERLREFCEENFPEGKNDLATVFLERCLRFCAPGGTTSVVLPQNWLFLTAYRKFREQLLKRYAWHMLARLGPGAFETISGEVVQAALLIASRDDATPSVASIFGQPSEMKISGVDVSAHRSAAEKANHLLTACLQRVEQAKQLENADSRVTLEESGYGELLSVWADGPNGMHGGDSPRFRFKFWELMRQGVWHYFQGTTPTRVEYAGREHVFFWPNSGELHRSNANARVMGDSVWGKPGVAVSMMGDLPATIYTGEKFDISCTPVVPHNPAHLPAIWCYCSSPEYNKAVRRIDQKLNVTNATLVKVPFDLDYWTRVAAERYPNGLPEPYSDDPTQWIFHGHPCGSVVWDETRKRTAIAPPRTGSTVLQIAVARMLGYKWPAELDPGMALSDESRFWVSKATELDKHADGDGIVCLPAVRGEKPAHERLLALLADAYNQADPGSWKTAVLDQLLAQAEHTGKSLETWLREKFFTQHCKLFKNRPFVWQVWDGLRDGFSALLSYHRLDYKNLETLVYTYLGDWIARQKNDLAARVDGAQERLSAAEGLKKRLELILEGESPYDIFVRWKPLALQPLGWNPDLDDGVRLNIRPFMSVPDIKKKGAGVLVDRPGIAWDKDRGKDVSSAPWYHLGPRYGGAEGDRINAHHLTLDEKRKARTSTR